MEEVVDRLSPGRDSTPCFRRFCGDRFLLRRGIYGVISCDVSERTHEMGFEWPWRRSRATCLSGSRTGRPGGVWNRGGPGGRLRAHPAEWRRALRLKATDAYTFASIPVLLRRWALAASYLPSRRALALDP